MNVQFMLRVVLTQPSMSLMSMKCCSSGVFDMQCSVGFRR